MADKAIQRARQAWGSAAVVKGGGARTQEGGALHLAAHCLKMAKGAEQEGDAAGRAFHLRSAAWHLTRAAREPMPSQPAKLAVAT